MNSTVLITGAGGFAGSHLLQLLSGRHELAAWGRSSPAPELLPLARWQQVNLLDRDRVRSLIRELRPTAIYHCAGSPHVAESFADTATTFANNVLATHHLFDALRRAGVHSRVLLTGSAAVYGSSDSPLTEDSPVAPANPYAHSKLAQEQLGLRAIPEDGLDIIVTRPFNHTGPRQTAAFMAPTMARQIASPSPVPPVLRARAGSARQNRWNARDDSPGLRPTP